MTIMRGISVLAIAAVVAAGVRFTLSADAQVPEVSHAEVMSGAIAETVSTTGTLQAVTTVQVGTQVSGVVQDLYADFNSLVKRGAIIARLDPSNINTQIAQARANLTRAQADLERLSVGQADARVKHERAKALAARGLLPQVELEAAAVAEKSADAQVRSARAAITQAEASLNQQLVNLNHTVIRAPIDGLVISRNVDRGQTVAASMSAPTLFVLAADLTQMQVVASVDESDVGRIRPQQTVAFSVDAYPNRAFTGTVSQVRLQPIVEQNVTTYATVIDVPNPTLMLKPGMTANVTIEIAGRENAVLVPNAALRFRPSDATYAALGLEPPDGTTPSTARRMARVPPDDGESGAPMAVSGSTAPETIDALFGPVQSPDTPGWVWVYDGAQLQPVSVRVGISNGQMSELLTGDLRPGMKLVTRVTVAGESIRSQTTPAPGGLFFGGARTGGSTRGQRGG